MCFCVAITGRKLGVFPLVRFSHFFPNSMLEIYGSVVVCLSCKYTHASK